MSAAWVWEKKSVNKNRKLCFIFIFYSTMLFNQDAAKFIAQFYSDNYDLFSGKAGKQRAASINARRNALLQKLTTDVNAMFGCDATKDQVLEKIKNLKKSSKEKFGEERRGTFYFS